jgi:hypothetical protein
MNRDLSQRQDQSLLDDARTVRKLESNYTKNREQDQAQNIDAAAQAFNYESCRDQWWNPPEYSLMHGTPLWDQASDSQRLVLNQLYWVAYYSQIISAEIATIVLNQTSAAGLNSYEDFRLVCDTLDLESSQERAHIAAFKKIGEAVEMALFGERMFTYPMRSMYEHTMLFADAGAISRFWRSLQIRAYAMLSSGNAFIGCQYFTVRGIRTLNGKMIQHGLAQVALKAKDRDATPIPSRVSLYHFMDESFHFNSSRILTHDVIHSLRKPTRFESWVANRALTGCQRDHFNVSVAIKGIFWYEPALLPTIERILRSPLFGMSTSEAKQMMWECFAEETDGLRESFRIHDEAVESYKAYLDPLAYVSRDNRTMAIMSRNNVARHLAENRRALKAMVA